ncbi:hypothetical protein HMPREF9336_02820 [Segniliparus rugosus ATCC BAA-974]|uniref:Thiamine pyrophosphokinase n=2 Tax=Segniliparus rugosus TaxID=286804 RepID=E5XTJ8_SEGRC|nr:hypothetical protein HMPREF9336_02820 [Segniliparus rugosus ATCC BAA-974]
MILAMKVALLSRKSEPLPGVLATARVGRDTAKLLRKVKEGDVVVIDEPDLDQVTADAFVEKGVAAVVNAAPSISGRYPNMGPEVLVSNNITLVDTVGDDVFRKVRDGAKVRLHEGGVYSGDKLLAEGVERDEAQIGELISGAKTSLINHLEAFSGNTIEFIRAESPLLIDSVGIPDVDVRIEGRHVVVVADGEDHEADLRALRPFIREFMPVLVGVGKGAEAIVRQKLRPDLIVGNPELISAETLKSGAQVILPAEFDGTAPGLERIQDLGIGAVTFPASLEPADLALILAHHHGASIIVTAGHTASLGDFFDPAQRGSSPSIFLTRLKVGQKLVDAKALASLYATKHTGGLVAFLAMMLLIAGVVLFIAFGQQFHLVAGLESLWRSAAQSIQGWLT